MLDWVFCRVMLSRKGFEGVEVIRYTKIEKTIEFGYYVECFEGCKKLGGLRGRGVRVSRVSASEVVGVN